MHKNKCYKEKSRSCVYGTEERGITRSTGWLESQGIELQWSGTMAPDPYRYEVTGRPEKPQINGDSPNRLGRRRAMTHTGDDKDHRIPRTTEPQAKEYRWNVKKEDACVCGSLKATEAKSFLPRQIVRLTTDHWTTRLLIRSRSAVWHSSQVRWSASGRSADSMVLVDKSGRASHAR